MTRILPAMILAIGLSTGPAWAQTVDTKEAVAESQDMKDVDIEADQMEVLDEQKKAIFRGNVVGKRGNVTLNAASLEVSYVESKQPDGTDRTEVTFLDAKGAVKIVTRSQTITGEWAKMDVKANDVTVGGKVKVVQGRTVLTGEKLFADLDTGKSEMTGGRVRGSFVPQQ